MFLAEDGLFEGKGVEVLHFTDSSLVDVDTDVKRIHRTMWLKVFLDSVFLA
jgi:hypothetical protein